MQRRAVLRIQRVSIKNFRCLELVEINFDEVTSFIGPNGAGKSSVLRALDWFFNGEKSTSLTTGDICTAAGADATISVSVTFDELRDIDRNALGETYAPVGAKSFTATRTWCDGEDKMSGTGRTFPDFDEIRKISSKVERRKVYNGLAEGRPSLNLPGCSTGDEVDAAMRSWETQNPDDLEDSILPATHFFGFNGRNVLSGIFDFVFVSADLRASEQSVEGRKTILGRILERALDRGALDAAYEQLREEFSQRQAKVNEEHLDNQLDSLGADLSAEVARFSVGRSVNLSGVEAELKPSPPSINLTVIDSLTETSVERQGHGFQRALLIAALKLLAERSHGEIPESTIVLAIEEPELFQHPTQERVFSAVLRSLAMDEDAGIQVAYATHSPRFIDAAFFDQVRRVSRGIDGADGMRVDIRHASMEEVRTDLEGAVTTSALVSRWNQVCTSGLAEALFSEAVVLVEGVTDKSILEGVAHKVGGVPLENIGVAIAEAGSKLSLAIPHAILRRLGIPCLVVFDNDSESHNRVAFKPKDLPNDPLEAEKIKRKRSSDQRKNDISQNKKLLNYLKIEPVDFPSGKLTDFAYAFEDNLETTIQREWPGWEVARLKVVSEERGAPDKNAATYALAARESADMPGNSILEVLELARSLVGPRDSLTEIRSC